MRKLRLGMAGAVLLVALSPAGAMASPFTIGFTADCYHGETFVTQIHVLFGPTKNAGTAFHIEGSSGILTSNGYAVNGQPFPPRGLPAVDARGDSVVCTGTFGGDEFEITGWITPRG